ncbi:MAG: hypothetical protein DMG13_02375 [Acidobacteria bacterium]|nr:MAG: hypothetical protein DMG13_02375 [Acidobacteriota bacterium]
MSRSHEIEVIEDLPALRGLESEWNEVAPPKDVEPWQSFSWIEAAATAYSQNHLLRIITVRKDGRLAGIAPMVLKPSEQPLKPLRLDFLGGEELKEPNRFIARDPAALDLLVDVIVSQHMYPIRLSRMPGDSENVNYLKSKFKQAGWMTATLSMPYPYVDLKDNPIKSSLKEDLRRARRKAEAFGKVRSEVLDAPSKEELMKHLETAFIIEGSGWKGKNGSAIVSTEPRRQFFERYACSAWKDGTLRLGFLMIDNTPVAVQYAIESANSYWLLNVGYDEKYQECSPGKLLLGESIKEAAKSGLVRYNFLGKEEPWTRRWTTNAQDCVVLAPCRPNLRGMIAMLSDALYMVKKRMKEQTLKPALRA